jgi:hypothetical protein
MLDRLSVAVSLATIFALLAKLALLYKGASPPWFEQGISDEAIYLLLISCFMIFFRGKMMHDDSGFFKDLLSQKFKDDEHSKFLIKSGIMAGYLSWLCWAPAVYFLETPSITAWCLIVSLAISTVWLVVDIMTRKVSDGDQQAKKRPKWIIINMLYAAPLIGIGNSISLEYLQLLSALLILILLVDWWMTDVDYVS